MDAPKIVFVGNARTGKTSCARALVGAVLGGRYVPTLGVETHPVRGLGSIWDCAGDPRFAGLEEAYYIGADVVVVFVDNEVEGDANRGRLAPEAWASQAKITAPRARIIYAPAHSDAATVRSWIEISLAEVALARRATAPQNRRPMAATAY